MPNGTAMALQSKAEDGYHESFRPKLRGFMKQLDKPTVLKVQPKTPAFRYFPCEKQVFLVKNVHDDL